MNKPTAKEIQDFMGRHKMNAHRLAKVLGVTKPAVDHWLLGKRDPSMLVGKVMRLIDAYPQVADALESMEAV